MTTAQDVSEKLIALRAWLSEARQELEHGNIWFSSEATHRNQVIRGVSSRSHIMPATFIGLA